jgi:menaquinone-dependent protoporphyrinogen oxidase
MRVLVTWGSKRGGTEGIGRMVAEALEAHGLEVVAASVEKAPEIDGFDAAVVGGALYANGWPGNVRRFVNRRVRELRKLPVWLFSSGPLDDSADREEIPPTTPVAVLAERVGAIGHVTFGGRLEPGAKGFPASAMAKTRSGDFRNPERIRAWAAKLAADIPQAKPGKPIDHPARSIRRLLAHGVVGWALCAAAMAGFLRFFSLTAALVLHTIAAPLFFSALAWHYFRARGAREPLPTAATWTAVVMLLDLVVVAVGLERSLAMFRSIAGTWLPLGLVFIVTWVIGGLMSTLPWPKAPT